MLLSIPSKVWLTDEPVALVPSPKFQLKLYLQCLCCERCVQRLTATKASALKAAVGWGFSNQINGQAGASVLRFTGNTDDVVVETASGVFPRVIGCGFI